MPNEFPPQPPSAEFDEPVGRDETSLSVIQAINSYFHEAEIARWDRIDRNRRNRDVFLGRQDWSMKQEGQSTEFLPKVPISVEQMSAFIKRALVKFGDWYSVKVDNSLSTIIDPSSIRALLDVFLENLWTNDNSTQRVQNVISDSVKNGMLESLMILKVHGGMQITRTFKAVPGEIETDLETGEIRRAPEGLESEETEEWRLRVDLVPPEDYYPDPSGRGLYEIHDTERDLFEVLDLAEQGVYDEDAVEQLVSIDYPKPEDQKRTDYDRAQNQAVTPSFRKRVRIREFWGTLLNNDGTVAHRNVVATVANDRFLIRPPEPNPFWHQESPFVVAPLIRVPWSVWHKALYDDASSLNLAINEMFNLMLDGGIAAVWGIKQVRLDELEDPGQVSGGIRQGDTLAVKSTLPHGQKVLEQVSEGDVPQDAMAMFEFLNREFTQAALTNEIKLGNLPPKEVRATEVVEASQSQAVTLDGIVADLEGNFMSNFLRKSWLTVLQNADAMPKDIITGTLDARTALILMRASPAERFALFAGKSKFTVHGISSTMAQMRDFQKLMALFQAMMQNPFLMTSFIKRYSMDAALDKIIKTLQINPQDLELDEQEVQNLVQKMQEFAQISAIINPKENSGRAGGLGGNAGQPGLQSDINQTQRPASGQPPNG